MCGFFIMANNKDQQIQDLQKEVKDLQLEIEFLKAQLEGFKKAHPVPTTETPQTVADLKYLLS